MSPPTDPLELAAEFPPASEQEWRDLVAATLRRSGRVAGDDVAGDDPVAALTHTDYDGITVQPLYSSADAPDPGRPGAAPYVRGATADGATLTGWDVRARHADPDPARTQAAALADLEGGASSLWLVLGAAGTPVADLPAVLDGIHLDLAPIALDAGSDTRAAATALLELVRSRGLDPGGIAGTLGADPIGLRARAGTPAELGLLGELAQLAGNYPRLCVATVDATVYHDAGGSDAVELAVSTAVGVQYLRALTDAGLTIDAALDAIEFRYAVTADQFSSIAKLRAARRIWGRVAELSGASLQRRGQRQHAVTSSAMMTRRDPWVNMLRTTLGCFAAAVGGADAITVQPFDAALGRPDELARRIARNTQAILHDESSLGRVVDAAGGSWYVETLTQQLADTAWQEFTALERDGGALAALDDGRLSRLIAAARDVRADDVAHRRAPITGVTEFALPDETLLARPPAAPAPAGGPLPPIRYAQDFEQLRDAADATDPRPGVFLTGLGPLPEHSARLAFATNLFRAGGLQVVVGSGGTEAVVAAFTASPATVACLCPADAVAAGQVSELAAALKGAGARYVWQAGRPGRRDPAAAEASDAPPGVDGFLFAGCDALQVLRTTLELAGVAP